MSNTTVLTVALERTSWVYDREQIVRSLSDAAGIREAYAAYLQNPDGNPAGRFAVNVVVRHRDDSTGADCNVGIYCYIDGGYRLSSNSEVWVFTGPTTDNSGDRVELMFAGSELVSVTLVTTRSLQPEVSDGQTHQG